MAVERWRRPAGVGVASERPVARRCRVALCFANKYASVREAAADRAQERDKLVQPPMSAAVGLAAFEKVSRLVHRLYGAPPVH